MNDREYQQRDDLLAAVKGLLIQAHRQTPSGRRHDRAMIARTERTLDWLRRTLKTAHADD